VPVFWVLIILYMETKAVPVLLMLVVVVVAQRVWVLTIMGVPVNKREAVLAVLVLALT
jgi:hypothetical protein